MPKEKKLIIGAGGFGSMVAEQTMLRYDCAFSNIAASTAYINSYGKFR